MEQSNDLNSHEFSYFHQYGNGDSSGSLQDFVAFRGEPVNSPLQPDVAQPRQRLLRRPPLVELRLSPGMILVTSQNTKFIGGQFRAHESSLETIGRTSALSAADFHYGKMPHAE